MRVTSKPRAMRRWPPNCSGLELAHRGATCDCMCRHSSTGGYPRCLRFPGQQWPGFFVCVSPEATGIEGADARPTLAPLHPRHQYTPYLHEHAAWPWHSRSFRKAQAPDRQNQTAAPDLGGPPPHRQRPSGHGFIYDTRRGSSIPRQQEIPKPESNIGHRRGCLG